MNLAERLQFYRKKCYFSQEQIAKQLNINRSTYSYYELGKTQPSIENLALLAKIFNISLSELAGVESETNTRGVNDGGFSDPDIESRLDKLLGTSKIGDLTRDEKRLIISFRTLTAEQQRELLRTISAYGVRNRSDAPGKIIEYKE